MLLGESLTLFPEWRLVEADLYDITGRVREYDRDARLVVNDEGELGLARFDEYSSLLPGGAMIFARICVDWAAGTNPLPELTGTPDARVLWDQRVTDAHRIKNVDTWNRMMRDRRHQAENRRKLRNREWNREMAERFVNIAQRKDLGWRPTIRVPKAIA
jgi:hypothetical protein